MYIPSTIMTIQSLLETIDAKAIIVGGYVRDTIMGMSESKDIDIEVYGIDDINKLKMTLESIAPVYEVGKSFGVLKMSLKGYDLDISLPRVESKTGSGHRGFSVVLQHDISFEKAASRRDFTMNAIGYDLQTQSYLDPYHGKVDIENRTIRMVNNLSFVEDPLRVLRAVQFCARFAFSLDEETLALCQKMVQQKMLDELPKERIFDEVKKLLLKSTKPSLGFKLLDDMGALFPEIKALKGVVQDSKYHPEGDVFVHTMRSLDVMAQEINLDEKEKLILMLAVLCHDFGKPESTQNIDGTISAMGHENKGLQPTKDFINRFTDETALFESVAPLVQHHLKPSQFYAQQSKSAAIRRLSVKVNIERVIAVARADFLGRTTKEAQSGIYKAGLWLRHEAEKLNVLKSSPKPLLGGRDLIEQGLKPSVAFKEILATAYDQQLEGIFKNEDDARAWLKVYLNTLGK